MVIEMEWNDSLELGVRPLDEQHRYILGLAIGVDRALRGGAAHAEVHGVFERLYDAFIGHFSYEEAMMLDADVMLAPSAVDAHVAAHKALLRRLETLERVIAKGGEMLSGWIEVDVAAVLVAEIARHDGELVTALAHAGHLRACD